MDKQKQIDGIFGVIDLWANNAVRENRCDRASVYNPYNAKDLAELIYNAGYRKIPENAVVLTETEYKGYCETQFRMFEELQRVRKEAAEKFAEMAKSRLNEWLEDNEDLNGKIDFGIAQIELIGVKSLEGATIKECIDEIYEEITEGMI